MSHLIISQSIFSFEHPNPFVGLSGSIRNLQAFEAKHHARRSGAELIAIVEESAVEER